MAEKDEVALIIESSAEIVEFSAASIVNSAEIKVYRNANIIITGLYRSTILTD